jgi:hypothetical protein
MKVKHNLILALCGIFAPLTAQAAEINVFGTRNNAPPAAPTYANTDYMKASFVSLDGGVDGGLGINIYVVHDDANLDGDGDPKTVTWTNDNTYFVRDKLFIPRGTTLTIEPGTQIYFSSNDNGTSGVPADDAVGALTACRGGKLIADGTATQPIVFTTDREWEVLNNAVSPISPDANIGPAPTQADAGLWGGIILLGQAYCSFVNSSGVNAGTVQIEGFAPAGSASYDGGGDTIPDATQYGTSNNFPRKDDDNSGIIRYCSLRHGGYEFATGKEINGLTMGGVGSGTIIEFVEVFANLDDGFEWFGGRVSCNNLISAFAQDDMFDIDEGYRGTLQFILAIQNPGDADSGSEMDGVGGSSGGYSTISSGGTLHHSKPLVYNATYIGAGANNTLSQITNRSAQVHWEKGNHAFNIEDYFNGEFYNSVFLDFAQGLARFIDPGNASIGNNMVFENNTFGPMGGGTPGDNLSYLKGHTVPYNVFFDGLGAPINGNSDVNTNPMFTAYTRTSGDPVTTNASTNNYLVELNPVPAPGSPLLTSPISGGAPKKVSYRGAFGPEGNWAAGWTKLSQSGLLTGAAPMLSGVDSDGDGIDDKLEASPALAALGFTVGENDVTNHGDVPGTNVFAELYTSGSIQDLRGSAMMIEADGEGPVSLTLPLFKSNNLDPESWVPAGNMTGTTPFVPGKQFYRIDVSSGVPNE